MNLFGNTAGDISTCR